MAKSIDALSSEYEAALAKHHDNPDDDRARAAADRAGERLAQARAADRSGRTGVGVATTDNDQEG